MEPAPGTDVFSDVSTLFPGSLGVFVLSASGLKQLHVV